MIVHRDESTFDEKKSSAKFEIVDGTLPVVSAAAPESTEEPTAASAASKRARPDTEEAFSVDADGCFVLDDEDGGEAAVKRSNTSPQ